MTIEQQIVRHLLTTRFEDLPEAAVANAKREVLWALGTAYAGAAATGSREIIEFVRQSGGRPEATVLGFGDRVPAMSAGFANGVFCKALEYEDKFWLDKAHCYSIGVAVVPAAFAVAEQLGGVSGKDFLLTIAVATDIVARMIKTALGCIKTGWNATYVFGSLGATLAATRLLRLDQQQAMNAMGLAYAQTAGNYQGHQEGVLGVRLMMGFDVRNGISAAHLAKLGLTGVHQFLTGKFGLYPLIYGELNADPRNLVKDLGDNFYGAQLGFKAYPCCGVIHSTLDAVLGLGADSPPPEMVESVQVYGGPMMKISAEPKERRKYPASDVETQFSIPWAVACALVDRTISLRHFSNVALKDKRYAELAPRVDIDMDPARDGVFVDIRLKDGRIIRTRTVDAPKGHIDNPLSTEEVAEKYRDCMRNGPVPLGDQKAEDVKDMVLSMENIPDVAAIMRAVA